MSYQWIQLNKAITFRVTGKDSIRYLHNRLSNDIRGLPTGAGCLAAALSAQGRVEGLFSVSCIAECEFILVCDGGELESILSAVKRFVVADRVIFEHYENTALIHIAEPSDRVGAIVKEIGVTPGCIVQRSRISSAGCDLLINSEDLGIIAEKLGKPLTQQSYDQLRWRFGTPVYPDEINDQGMILEYGLREAVSFTKGCYVGQEVVERSDAIGKLPRKLERIELKEAGLVDLGTSITSLSGEVLGKVIGVIPAVSDDNVYLFALLRGEKYKQGDEVLVAGRSGVICGEGKYYG